MKTTLFRTANTTYLLNHTTGVLSSERPTGLVVEIIDVDSFDIVVGQRAHITGTAPGHAIVGGWFLNTSPVQWATTYTTVAA